MGGTEEDCSAGCSFSLMCQEDGADLFAGFADYNPDGKLIVLYSDAEEEDEEEYMNHLLSKESSCFCLPSSSSSSSSSSSAVFSDAGAESPPLTMALEDWFQGARRASVKWILEMRAYFGFCHRTAYLAIAYLDRFCVHRCIDRSAVPWAARLLAVACMSLAAKMEEYRAPALSEFRAGDGEYDFSCASIRRMELLVLSTLGWRMGGVTPFDYLPCLSARLRRANGGGGGGGSLVAAKEAALIFSAAEAASVLDYRPSTVAAAAVLAATHGALTKEALESQMSCLSPSCLIDKEDVHACYSMMLTEPSPSSSTTTTTTRNNTAKRPSSCSDSIDAGATSTCDSVVDAALSNTKRTRLESAGIRR